MTGKLTLSGAPSSAAEGKEALRKILAEANFALVDTFSSQGTQAFFCTRQVKLDSGLEKTIAYLVFRGTEPKDFRDIKSDVRASLKSVEVDGETIQLHSGYHDAFEVVKEDLQAVLRDTAHDQLFITGHSLGGALAIVTTRILASGITGACYTFGAPPVGTIDVQNKLKTPVYEIINEVDIVPRLPNPWAASAIKLFLRLLRLLLKSVTVVEKALASGTWDEKLESFIDAMTKYRHPGYQSYLVGLGNDARLRVNLGGYDRFNMFRKIILKKSFTQFKKLVEDHSIDVYVGKLKVHALRRQ